MREDLELEYVEFVRARLPRLRRVAHLLCGDHDRADDLVQSTVTRVYVRWRQVRSADNIDGYVHTILLRTFLSELRRPWTRVVLRDTAPDDVPARGDPIDERLVVRAALRRLPPRQQAVLVLRFLCDLPVAEVATLLGCGEGTVKRQTFDGLAKLRRLLESSPNPAVHHRSGR